MTGYPGYNFMGGMRPPGQPQMGQFPPMGGQMQMQPMGGPMQGQGQFPQFPMGGPQPNGQFPPQQGPQPNGQFPPMGPQGAPMGQPGFLGQGFMQHDPRQWMQQFSSMFPQRLMNHFMGGGPITPGSPSGLPRNGMRGY